MHICRSTATLAHLLWATRILLSVVHCSFVPVRLHAIPSTTSVQCNVIRVHPDEHSKINNLAVRIENWVRRDIGASERVARAAYTPNIASHCMTTCLIFGQNGVEASLLFVTICWALFPP